MDHLLDDDSPRDPQPGPQNPHRSKQPGSVLPQAVHQHCPLKVRAGGEVSSVEGGTGCGGLVEEAVCSAGEMGGSGEEACADHLPYKVSLIYFS